MDIRLTALPEGDQLRVDEAPKMGVAGLAFHKLLHALYLSISPSCAAGAAQPSLNRRFISDLYGEGFRVLQNSQPGKGVEEAARQILDDLGGFPLAGRRVCRSKDLMTIASRVGTTPIGSILLAWILIAYGDEPVKVIGDLFLPYVTVSGDLEVGIRVPTGGEVEYSAGQDQPPFWRVAGYLALAFHSIGRTESDSLKDIMWGLAGLSSPLDPSQAAIGKVPISNLMVAAIQVYRMLGDVTSSTVCDVMRVAYFFQPNAQVLGLNECQAWIQAISDIGFQLYGCKAILAVSYFSNTFLTVEDHVGLRNKNIPYAPRRLIALEAADIAEADANTDEEDTDQEDTDPSKDESQKAEDSSDETDDVPDPRDADVMPKNPDTGEWTPPAMGGSNPKNKSAGTPIVNNNTMDFISLVKSGESVNAYLYRVAVLRLEESIRKDPDIALSAESRQTLSSWCGSWLHLASIKETQSLLKSLGLEKVMGPFKRKEL